MKRTTSLVLISLMAFAVAQKKDPLVFRDDKKNPTIILQGDGGFYVPYESFELDGNVSLKLIPQQLTLACNKASGKILGSKGKTEIDNVRLTGGVKITVDNKAFLVTINGGAADYDLQNTSRLIKLKGNSTFNFKSKGEPASSLDAKSSNADISLSRTDNIVLTASMTGGVTLNGVEMQKVDNGFKRVKFSVKAQSLKYAEKGADGNREVRLEKDIVVTRASDEGEAEVTGQVKTTLKKGDR
jgi:hypothetical protein